jgi:hypothetical protein
MAQVRIEKKSNMTVMVAGGLIAVTAIGAWWFSSSESDSPAPATSAASDAGIPPIPPMAASEPAAAEAALPAASVAAIQAEQEAANNEVNKAVIPPLKGTTSSRPAFLSSMEWDMLRGVADAQANPDESLTKLINTTLFYKQLERWQELQSSQDMATRQALAQRLLDDLPQRVTNDDMPIPDVLKLQVELLVDAEPDPKARASRAKSEAKRLVPPPAAN